MMAFEYYEVRPVIEANGTCEPFDTVEDWEAIKAELTRGGVDFNAFWTVYGRYQTEGGSEVQAIGDFVTKESALAIVHGILGIPAKARDLLQRSGMPPGVVVLAANALEDMINQSSNAERL